MQNHLSDLVDSDTEAGFRLDHVEFLNWGTFDGRIWSFSPGGTNALLTGDIGSGKSTIVDALTTLLVPPQRITYNKAAGAETRERDLRSYVLGYYKSEKENDRLSAKPVALRSDHSLSVLIARFHNHGLSQSITLAQVFWMQPSANQPKRLYLVSESDLGIKPHFTNFGTDIRQLKRKLGMLPGVELFDSFSKYESAYHRKLGIYNPKAMDLFYQTVSMKSVGNLTDFVRNHMLEPGDSPSRIESVCRSFDNLNQAHESVLKAKRQIEALAPLVEDGRRYVETDSEKQGLVTCRDALYPYFAEQKAGLLAGRIEKQSQELKWADDRLHREKLSCNELRGRANDLRQSIAASGGQRLDEIAQGIKRFTEDRNRTQAQLANYTLLCTTLDLTTPADDRQFHDNRQRVEQALGQVDSENKSLDDQKAEAQFQWRNLQARYDELDAEIKSLAARRSNIPSRQLAMRRDMCDALGADEDTLPYVGELIQVREDQAEWRGAAERLLHGFGLSVLVPDALYPRVSAYVDQTHLRGRLVYFRVKDSEASLRLPGHDSTVLWRKLQVKAGRAYTPWLEHELARRFDHHCCSDLSDFRRHAKAITPHGQIKSGGIRHEKDDRHRIDDAARFVLGWDNRQKLAALTQDHRRIAAEGQVHLNTLRRLDDELKAISQRRDAMRDLLKFEGYTQIDWRPVAERIDGLERERKEIESSSDTLGTLRKQLKDVESDLGKKESRLESLRDDRAGLQAKIRQDEEARIEAQQVADQDVPGDRDTIFAELRSIRSGALGDKPLTLKNVEASQTVVREFVQRNIDAAEKRLKSLAEKIIGQMQDYINSYRAETREVDASLASLDEFGSMLDALVQQDLPRHEERFRRLLNEGTINDIAMLQNQLVKESRDIREKIDEINGSLREIDYNPSSYIQIRREPSPDREVQDFRADLKSCLGGMLANSADELYTEQKFHQVKELIDRFVGREGTGEADRRWTRKVTDVRNWSVFAASERWREDDTEREFYSDSAGKSGGQKEKLAYTILASALAYQFGLKPGQTQSRSFRFVMIDEAFGRGSDESARYGLEIFKKLNLQLLIITPLQKIHVIEDFVRSVHFVHNDTGERSELRNMTITTYHEEKARRSSGQPEDKREAKPSRGDDR